MPTGRWGCASSSYRPSSVHACFSLHDACRVRPMGAGHPFHWASHGWAICVVHCMFFLWICVWCYWQYDIVHNLYAMFVCLVGICFSSLTCLWFISSLISKSAINHYNLFFKKQTWICIFIKYRFENFSK